MLADAAHQHEADEEKRDEDGERRRPSDRLDRVDHRWQSNEQVVVVALVLFAVVLERVERLAGVLDQLQLALDAEHAFHRLRQIVLHLVCGWERERGG